MRALAGSSSPWHQWPARGAQRLLDVCLLAVPLGCALCIVSRWTSLDSPLAAAAAGLVPAMLVTVAVATVVAVLMRRRFAGSAGFVCLLAAGAVVAPGYSMPGDARPGGERLTVVTANVYFRGGDVPEAAAAVTSQGADVVALQEVTPDFAAVVARRAEDAGYRWRVMKPARGSTGLAVLSRLPIVGHRELTLNGQPLLRVDLAVAGTVLRLYDVHVEAPVTPPAVRRWRGQLDALREVLEEPSAGPVVAAGDFNASLDHLPFRRLLGADRQDAAAARRRWWLPTWPARHGLLPPLLQLDHVVVSQGVSTSRVRTARCPGSDHRMLITSLVVAVE